MSATQERKIICYPPPKYYGLIRALSEINDDSVSETVSDAIRCKIESLPPDQKIKVINAAKKYQSKNSY